MQRRDLVLGAVGGAAGVLLARPAAAAVLPVPAAGQLSFKVLRSGTPIGEHHVTFTQTGGQLRVDTNSVLVMKMAGIPIYHYTVKASEYWSDGAFSGLDSQVNQNGTLLSVHAAPIAGGFAVQSTKAGNYNYTGQPAMMPLTYWNKAMLAAMILNIETGRHYPAIVNSPGWNDLPTAEGGVLLAQRFDVTGKLHLSVWYDQYGQWAGLQFRADGLVSLEKFVS